MWKHPSKFYKSDVSQCQENSFRLHILMTYRSASWFFDFQLWERLVDVEIYWQNCSWLCNYIFDFSGRPALLSRKKGTIRGTICSEIWRGVGLEVMKVMLTWIFFCRWVYCQARSHPCKGKSKLAIFLLGWELGKAVICTLSLTVRQMWLDAEEVPPPSWPVHHYCYIYVKRKGCRQTGWLLQHLTHVVII